VTTWRRHRWQSAVRSAPAEVERQRQIKAHAQALRAAEKAHTEALRAQERARVAATKQAQQEYLAAREAEAQAQNAAIASRVAELQTVLEQTLDVDDTIAFDSLHIQEAFPPLNVPPSLSLPVPEPQRDAFFAGIKAPGALQRLVPGAQRNYEQAMQAAEARFQEALRQHAAAEEERQRQRAQFEAAYEQDRKAFMLKVQQRIQEVAALEEAYRAGEPSTVEAYVAMVLERSSYPEGFPQQFRIVYRPEAKECVLEYELPGPEIVPATTEYRYVKARDALEAKPRKAAEIKELYPDVVAAVCLRTVHEVFESDQGKHIALVTINGCVRTVDPATGRNVMPCLISVRVARERFDDLNLRRIDKRACLRTLGAQVSSRPEEMQPVKPVVEFDMVDKRFIEQSDLLGSLESRPNLLELTPANSSCW
jgi:restriction system protein